RQYHSEKVFYRAAVIQLSRLVPIVRKAYKNLTEQIDIKRIYNQRQDISNHRVQQSCFRNKEKMDSNNRLGRNNQQHYNKQKPLVPERKINFRQSVACQAVYNNTQHNQNRRIQQGIAHVS